jgi:hypothetical protein
LFYALCGNIALNNLFNAFAMHVALGSITGPEDARAELPSSGSFGSLELIKGPPIPNTSDSLLSYAERHGRCPYVTNR